MSFSALFLGPRRRRYDIHDLTSLSAGLAVYLYICIFESCSRVHPFVCSFVHSCNGGLAESSFTVAAAPGAMGHAAAARVSSGSTDGQAKRDACRMTICEHTNHTWMCDDMCACMYLDRMMDGLHIVMAMEAMHVTIKWRCSNELRMVMR